MPFYTFRTTDKGVKNKEFLVQLSFNGYDEVMAGDRPLIHPDTEKPVKKWKRILDNVNYNFAQPEDSSRYDNFEYRAAHKLMKAKEERRVAQAKSHMGQIPYEKQEQKYIEGGQVEMGGHNNIADHDIANYEGKVV